MPKRIKKTRIYINDLHTGITVFSICIEYLNIVLFHEVIFLLMCRLGRYLIRDSPR